MQSTLNPNISSVWQLTIHDPLQDIESHTNMMWYSKTKGAALGLRSSNNSASWSMFDNTKPSDVFDVQFRDEQLHIHVDESERSFGMQAYVKRPCGHRILFLLFCPRPCNGEHLFTREGAPAFT